MSKNQVNYLPPKSDIVFKLLFANIHNEEILAYFLKAVLALEDAQPSY